jgi:hypothetical protein
MSGGGSEVALWQRGCGNSECCARDTQCGRRGYEIGNLRRADKLVAEARRNPSTEEGGGAKLWRVSFVSNE